MSTQEERGEREKLANVVRGACVQAAREGYKDAAVSGLCHEGATEAAISAIQMLDLDAIITQLENDQKAP